MAGTRRTSRRRPAEQAEGQPGEDPGQDQPDEAEPPADEDEVDRPPDEMDLRYVAMNHHVLPSMVVTRVTVRMGLSVMICGRRLSSRIPKGIPMMVMISSQAAIEAAPPATNRRTEPQSAHQAAGIIVIDDGCISLSICRLNGHGKSF